VVQKSSSISDSEARQKLRVELFLAVSITLRANLVRDRRFTLAIGLRLHFHRTMGIRRVGIEHRSHILDHVLCCVGLLAPRSFSTGGLRRAGRGWNLNFPMRWI